MSRCVASTRNSSCLWGAWRLGCNSFLNFLQKFKQLIDDKYRINLVLDNLPVTAQDLLDQVNYCRGLGFPDPP